MNPKPRTGIADVRAHYDEMGGSSYDLRYSEEQESKYTLALDSVRIVEAELVLDLGCGTGLFMDRQVVRANSLVGLDVSAELLSTAKKRLGRRTNASLILSDAHHLPFRAAVFDKAFMFTIAQDSPQPVFLLSETIRVLKSSGGLIVSGLKKSFNPDSFQALLEKSSLSISRFTDENFYDYIAVCVARHPSA